MAKLNRQSIIIYLTKIRLNFENAYPISGDEEMDLLVESWFDALKQYPKEVCDCAVNNALKKAKFAPRLGDITEEAEKILNADLKTDEELWAELTKVLNKVYEVSRYLSYPHYVNWAQAKLTEIFKSLDKTTQAYLVNNSALVELAELSDEALRFEKTRFFKQIPTLRKRCEEREKARLLLKQVSQPPQLPNGTKK